MNRDPRWTIQEVSAFLQIPVETLYAWHRRKYGPIPAKVGRYLRYDPDAVVAWLERMTAPAA